MKHKKHSSLKINKKEILRYRGHLIIPGCFIGIIWLLSAYSVQKPFETEKPPDDLPNIIIILADDLGYGDLGGYYGGQSKTPNLNRLAMEGMIFTDFHSNGPMCSPTRASLLTGRYPQRLNVETAQRNVLDSPQNQDEITMAEYLRNAGYSTGIIGKWHLGRPQEGNPVKFGFDRFVGYYGGDLDYFSKIDRYGIKDWWYNENLLEEEGYVTELITKHSIEFIKEHKNNPFFLYISHCAIHFPWQGPEDNDLWIRNEGVDYTSSVPGPASKLGPHPPENIPAVLYSMIEELDRSVGRIIETVRELDIEQNTLVFFTSDNGGYLNYGDDTWPIVGSNGPLRGQKSQLYEGGHRVPAIAWWPDHIPALSASDETIMTMDLLPTVLDLLKIKLLPEGSPNFIDGVSILPLLIKGEDLEPRTCFWRIGTQKAVRYGPWKLIMEDKFVNLYNLETDIGETTHLTDQYPEKVDELKKRLVSWEKSIDHLE